MTKTINSLLGSCLKKKTKIYLKKLTKTNMSTRQYQNRSSKNDDYLDDLYDRLSDQKQESETDLAQNLTNSVKALSRRWLQEAYLDGMMLADKLHKVTFEAKNKLDDIANQKPVSQNVKAVNSNDIALIVRQELQKLGLSTQNIEPEQKTNQFANFLFGSALILSSFFIIGGAISFYGLDGQVKSFVGQTYASLSGSQKADQPQNSNQAALNTAKVATPTQAIQANNPITKVATAQNPSNQALTPSQTAPSISLPNAAANAQNLTSTAADNSQTTSNANPNNPTQPNDTANSASNLPASCNGQAPQVNRPLDIQNPSDRAVLYCILDLQSQKQTTTQSTPNTQTSTSTQDQQTTSQTPNPSTVPQR